MFARLEVLVGLDPGHAVLVGAGENVGAALVTHPGVDKIAFTGSTLVGKAINKAATDTLKRVSLELGGKSPTIIFADATFESAIRGALFGVFANQGEVCSATSRILVERSIYPRVLEALVERARTIRLGPGADRETRMGPLVNARHLARVREYQEIGKREAKLALGGGRATGGTLDTFTQAVYNYPTLSEAYKAAALDGLERVKRRSGPQPEN